MNLLELQDASLVEKTNLTRKLTLGGVTKAYPVYRVRLNLLYYNDQNDRIATWITQYKSDPENAAFDTLDREQYNKTIEGFIIASKVKRINRAPAENPAGARFFLAIRCEVRYYILTNHIKENHL